jgi:carbon storage regulator
MLVLSRKKGESIVLADSIIVTVVDVKRGAVRLGVTAPPDVRVLREELVNRTHRRPAAEVPSTTGP